VPVLRPVNVGWACAQDVDSLSPHPSIGVRDIRRSTNCRVFITDLLLQRTRQVVRDLPPHGYDDT
jgi:hypothetical protein